MTYILSGAVMNLFNRKYCEKCSTLKKFQLVISRIRNFEIVYCKCKQRKIIPYQHYHYCHTSAQDFDVYDAHNA